MIDQPCDEDVRFVLKDKEGRIRGGVSGHIALYCYFVEELWVDEALRGRGFGQALLNAAEERARAKGCTFAQTNTFSFQSPGFYSSQGYVEIAEVDGFPSGVKHHYFKKRL
jgi:GNAT superfamily N-acetyltransferase